MTTPIQYNNIVSPFEKCPEDVLLLIISKTCEDSWRPCFRVFPFLNKSFKCLTEKFFEKVYKKHFWIEPLPLNRRFFVHFESAIIFNSKRWVKPIHEETRRMLELSASPGFETYKDKWQILIKNVRIDAVSSSGQTALLMICELAAEFLTRIDIAESRRSLASHRCLWITEQLLENGADPNLQAKPSLPLKTVMARDPADKEDLDFTIKMVKLLMTYKADPYLIPKKRDAYGSTWSPMEYAQKRYKALVPYLTSK